MSQRRPVPYWKSWLWSLLAVVIIVQTQELTMLFLHPLGGGVYHEIFAYSGGRPEVAMKVLLEYVAADSLILALLIIFSYPLNGNVLTILVAAIGTFSWWKICRFPYQEEGFRKFCLAYLGFVPLVICLVGKVMLFVKERGGGRT